ncbi:dephospho-CoA kinase [Arcanobacterium ihumii]|uniref:dephospho-CoA kinase n=1 Tax=Arcanobacterium ihumii TaxID=2138162 RepID=UPI000F52B677|nr:dephospho-CoA kinase [Arcanobacterium ihumii]
MNKLADRFGLRTSPAIFFSAAGIIIIFTLAMSIFPGVVQTFFGRAATFLRFDLSWFFTLSVTLLVIFSVVLALSRYGNVKLGDDDAVPEYSGIAWFGMLFAAGVGAVLMFWGIAEPINHYANPPLGGTEPFTDQAASQALSIANFHFAIHMWAILIVPGLAFGYFTYKRRLPPRVSSAFQPLLGDGIHGPIGKAIDVLAIAATVFGLSVSVGLGALQINSGANYVFGIEVSSWAQTLIVLVITAVGLGSVLAGMDKGVKRLSYINIVLACVVLVFVLVFGSTSNTMRAIVESAGAYIRDLPVLSFFNDVTHDGEWSGTWTVFYWAWTATWAPFVGMFVAKISKGRTIREFVFSALGVPSIFVIIWIGIYGWNAFTQDRATASAVNTAGDLTEKIVTEGNVQAALFQFLQGFPLYSLTAVLALVVIVLFFITSIDSGALVIDAMANGYEDAAPRRQRVFWTLSVAAVCGSIILTSGENGLSALQEVIIVIGFPVMIMTFVQMLMVIQALREDAGAAKPMRTRQWKQVLPAEEYERRVEDPELSVEEFVVSPEFDPDTKPEFETHTPNTRAVKEAEEGMPKLSIAVTGGAASGTSIVADEFARLGATLINADQVNSYVLETDDDVRREIEDVFGSDVISSDGTLNRSELGHLVFSSFVARERLEAILHPRVTGRIEELARAAGEDAVVVVDVPLLVESDSTSRFTHVIAVSAPVEQRVERLMEEKGINREEAWSRLEARVTDEVREEVATFVLMNDADLESLRASVRKFWAENILPELDESKRVEG